MANIDDLKERLSFRVVYAKVWYGNGPFDNEFRPGPHDEPESNEGHPILYLELQVERQKLQRLLGKRPATALIHQHPTGQKKTGTGTCARGKLNFGEIQDDDGTYGCLEILGSLPPEPFHAAASALIAGGRELLARCRLEVGLKEERDKIDFEHREGPLNHATFLVEDLAISFETGERYDDLEQE